MIRIKKEDYSSLKKLYVNDKEAFKYKFPVHVISENTDNTLNVKMIEYPSSYLLLKQPWLSNVLLEHTKNEDNNFWANIKKYTKQIFKK